MRHKVLDFGFPEISHIQNIGILVQLIGLDGSPSYRPAVPLASGAQFPQPQIPNLRFLATDPKLKIPS